MRLLTLLVFSISHLTFAAAPSSDGIPAVHSRAELEARMAAGNTPLDAFTPYGKRAFPGTLMWGEKGLGGFGTAMPTRELSAAQIGELLRFLDSAGYVGMLTRDLQDSQPLRFPAPSADLERASLAFKKIVEADARRRLESGDARRKSVV